MIPTNNESSAVLENLEVDDFTTGTLAAESSKETLHRLLSVRTQISTTSSFALFQNSQLQQSVGFHKIGFGQCGLVFEQPGRGFVVKVARPHFHDALWCDFVAHFHVYTAFTRQSVSALECRVPAIYAYINKDNAEWWAANTPLFPERHEDFPLPSMALVTERILPLPKVVREALVTQYCPPNLQASVKNNPSNRDCLARVYLGRRRPENAPLAPNFTLRNFNLSLDQMLELELPIDDYATAIGEALAVIHWQANVDGYDVEFVLGSEPRLLTNKDVTTGLGLTPELVASMQPHTDLSSLHSANFRRRTTRLWVLDFNLCNRWEEHVAWEHSDALVAQLVTAFFENDPYYPLPLVEGKVEQDLWETFANAYLERSRVVIEAERKDQRLFKLPGMFITACVGREQNNLDAGLGHGHRDHKD